MGNKASFLGETIPSGFSPSKETPSFESLHHLLGKNGGVPRLFILKPKVRNSIIPLSPQLKYPYFVFPQHLTNHRNNLWNKMSLVVKKWLTLQWRNVVDTRTKCHHMPPGVRLWARHPQLLCLSCAKGENRIHMGEHQTNAHWGTLFCGSLHHHLDYCSVS